MWFDLAPLTADEPVRPRRLQVCVDDALATVLPPLFPGAAVTFHDIHGFEVDQRAPKEALCAMYAPHPVLFYSSAEAGARAPRQQPVVVEDVHPAQLHRGLRRGGQEPIVLPDGRALKKFGKYVDVDGVFLHVQDFLSTMPRTSQTMQMTVEAESPALLWLRNEEVRMCLHRSRREAGAKLVASPASVLDCAKT